VSHPLNISCLYTNIGRGHPFYLDGVIEELGRLDDPPEIGVYDALTVSRGLANRAWRVARWMYRRGSSGGPFGQIYSGLRKNRDYGRRSPTLALLGRDLRRLLRSGVEPLVVAHPILVGILRDRDNLVYQHGEVVAPGEALVRGASFVMVPTEQVAQAFFEAGYDRSQLIVSGLCIEPLLVSRADEVYGLRSGRLQASSPLTGLFVSSGAEPKEHVSRIISSITSSISAGATPLVLARKGGRLEREVIAVGRSRDIDVRVMRPGESADRTQSGCLLGLFESRVEEAMLATQWFDRLDFLVAPPHERTNWAIGLGLPMFALTPTIGPFAPLNLSLLLDSGTTMAIESDSQAARFGELLTELHRSGRLVDMARRGWGQHEINGFAQIAEFLVNRYRQ